MYRAETNKRQLSALLTNALGSGAISGQLTSVPGAAIRLARINARLVLRPTLWSQARTVLARFNLISPTAVAASVTNPAAFRIKVRKAISDLSVLVGLPPWKPADDAVESEVDAETRDISGFLHFLNIFSEKKVKSYC